MAASEFCLLSLLLALSFSASGGEPPLRDGGVSSESSAVGVELELLKSKIASLESSIDDRNRELREKEENFAVMQKMIQEKLETIALLRSEIELLQESLVGKEDMSKSDRQAGELEKQVERLRKDIEMQNKKKDGLGARASEAEKKIQKLNSKLEKLHKVNDEQENRVRKTEHLLQVAEEELMKAEVESALLSKGLKKAQGGWLPDWFSIHLDYIQLYMVSFWNASWRPAMDLSVRKALDKKAQLGDWIKLQIEMVTVDWIPILKEHCSTFITFLKPRVKSLTVKIADLYHASESSIAPHAMKVLKDLCSYTKEWIPTLKERWSAFMSSFRPHLQLLITTIVDAYHASKNFIAPHACKFLKFLNLYTQEAMKFTGTYMHQIAIVARSCFHRVYFTLKSYAVKIFRVCGRLITVSTFYHHQVQEMLKSTPFLQTVANMEVAWFVATAFLAVPALFALFLFTLCSAVFRIKSKKQIQSSNTNHTRHRYEQAHPAN